MNVSGRSTTSWWKKDGIPPPIKSFKVNFLQVPGSRKHQHIICIQAVLGLSFPAHRLSLVGASRSYSVRCTGFLVEHRLGTQASVVAARAQKVRRAGFLLVATQAQ